MNNTFWRLERFIIDTRMRASHGVFYGKLAVLWWFVFTVVAFCLAFHSPEKKREVAPWVIDSVVSATPLKVVVKTIYWNHKPYEPGTVAPWLSKTVFKGTLSEWLLWCAGLGFLGVTLIGTIGWRRIARKESNEQHIRGAEILTVKELQRRIGKQKGIEIAGVVIPEALRTRHFLICGSTGSGKTVSIRQMLRQYAARGENAIVVDVEGELTAEFYDPERGDVLLNQLDQRASWWDIVKECENPAALKLVAASLFPVVPGMTDAATFYHRQARRVFEKSMTKLLITGMVDTRELLEIMENVLHKEKKTSLLSTVENGLDTFEYLAPKNEKWWTAREWVQNPTGWCFLSTREDQKELTLPQLSLFLDLLTRRLLSARRNPGKILPVVIDELAALRVQPMLPELGNRGRKRGVSLTIGFQNHSQLVSLYGEAGTVDLLDPPATRLLLQANNYETQEWCAKQVGEREILRAVESETAGPDNVRDSINRSHQQRVEEAVLSSQFKQLHMQGYLGVDSYGWALLDVPRVFGVERQPDFIPRMENVRASEDNLVDKGKKAGEERAARLKRLLSAERRAV